MSLIYTRQPLWQDLCLETLRQSGVLVVYKLESCFFFSNFFLFRFKSACDWLIQAAILSPKEIRFCYVCSGVTSPLAIYNHSFIHLFKCMLALIWAVTMNTELRPDLCPQRMSSVLTKHTFVLSHSVMSDSLQPFEL